MQPAHALFVGDNLATDVRGPQAAGMRAMLLARDGTSLEAEATIQTLGRAA